MAKRTTVAGIKPYDSPAGGWGAVRATAKAVREQMDVHVAPLLLLRTNKPDGFDCPGCAWPEVPPHRAPAVASHEQAGRIRLPGNCVAKKSPHLDLPGMQLRIEGRHL